MHTRSKKSESEEPASTPMEETTIMQENIQTATPETSENITQEQVEAGDSGEINPNKNDDITSMFALLIQRFDKSQEENRKSHEETKKDIRRMEEKLNKIDTMEEKLNKIDTMEDNIKEQIKNQSIELREDMMRMREKDRKERERVREEDKRECKEVALKIENRTIEIEKCVEENVKRIACNTSRLENIRREITEVVVEEKEKDINKQFERLIKSYPKLAINWENTEKEGNQLKEIEDNKQVNKGENEFKNEAKELIKSIVKHGTQEIKLNDINGSKNEISNENMYGKLNVNRSKQEYSWGMNKEEILNGENKKKNKHNNMGYKNIVRNKRRKILRQRKQDDINEGYGENREPISMKIIRYLNKTTRKYHKNHIVIHGTRIARRTAKRKPNVLFEGPFRIKTNGSL